MLFRDVVKTKIGLRLPTEVVEAIAVASVRRKMSKETVVTEAVCRHLGLDPAAFGIKAALPATRTRPKLVPVKRRKGGAA